MTRKPPRAALTDEQRAERRRQEQELTEHAVCQLRSSAGWQRWLSVRARVGLRRYTLLISGRVCRRRLFAVVGRQRHVAEGGCGGFLVVLIEELRARVRGRLVQRS